MPPKQAINELAILCCGTNKGAVYRFWYVYWAQCSLYELLTAWETRHQLEGIVSYG